ncbi:MAG: enoyl-ACP reductase [bacterium]|nr:enoyl-ACP reductase [bacterium]
MNQLMQGKKGIIFGVSNKRGIAYAIAKAINDAGGEIAFTYANEAMESRVRPLAEEMGSTFVEECDVTKEEHINNVFEKYAKQYDGLDFIIHSVAFANREDISGKFVDITLEGWNLAMHVSAYSLISITRAARPLLREKSSIIALTYLGGEKSVPNYNMMGVAKSALDSNVRYLAAELGPDQIRVNAISAGPIKTLAAKGISGFDILLKVNEARSPMKRNVTLEEVGNAGLYFASDLSTAVTGEIHHVDCGFHSIALCKEDAKIVGIEPH